MSSTEVQTLRVERTVKAAPEDVFDAWTDPQVLRRWWAAGPGWETVVAEVDARPGGAYTLSMRRRDGSDQHTVRGTYEVVRRPEQLIYTWAWQEPDGRLGEQSTVTVQFIAEGEHTRVVILHEGLASGDSAASHEQGWQGVLGGLEQFFQTGNDNEEDRNG